MANKRITDLTEITNLPEDGVIEVVDVTNTTDSPDGSSFKIKKSNLFSNGSQNLQETTDLGNSTSNQIELIGKGQSKGLSFDNQTIHSLGVNGLGHTTVQEKTEDSGTRFYVMPKGTPTGEDSLKSGIKLFSTDYESDATNYHDAGIFVTGNEIIFNSKQNGTFPKQLPFVWKFQDTNILMRLPSQTVGGGLRINVPQSLDKEWQIFSPLHIGETTCLLGRLGVNATELTNNAYFNNGWKRLKTGFAQRQTMDTNGNIVYWVAVSGSADSVISWVKSFQMNQNGTFDLLAATFSELESSPDSTVITKEWANTSFKKTINNKSGSSYTLVLLDKNKTIVLSNNTSVILNIPLESSVNYDLGTEIRVIYKGSGVATINGGLNTIYENIGLTLNQGDCATLIKIASDEWAITK